MSVIEFVMFCVSIYIGYVVAVSIFHPRPIKSDASWFDRNLRTVMLVCIFANAVNGGLAARNGNAVIAIGSVAVIAIAGIAILADDIIKRKSSK